jgi:hypothetical protein
LSRTAASGVEYQAREELAVQVITTRSPWDLLSCRCPLKVDSTHDAVTKLLVDQALDRSPQIIS